MCQRLSEEPALLGRASGVPLQLVIDGLDVDEGQGDIGHELKKHYDVTWVFTSRKPLTLRGSTVFALAPLDWEEEYFDSPDSVSAQLFLQAIKASRPAFSVEGINMVVLDRVLSSLRGNALLLTTAGEFCASFGLKWLEGVKARRKLASSTMPSRSEPLLDQVAREIGKLSAEAQDLLEVLCQLPGPVLVSALPEVLGFASGGELIDLLSSGLVDHRLSLGGAETLLRPTAIVALSHQLKSKAEPELASRWFDSIFNKLQRWEDQDGGSASHDV